MTQQQWAVVNVLDADPFRQDATGPHLGCFPRQQRTRRQTM